MPDLKTACNPGSTIILTKNRKIMKTRRQAAMELLPLYNAMETRKITLGTLARKMYKCGDCWRCVGVGYDYTV
jgi:hypothetical protein